MVPTVRARVDTSPSPGVSAGRWAAHNVRIHGTGIKQFHHHIVGDLTLAYESLDLQAEPNLTMTIYAAEPGSPTEDALRLLASWAASQQPATTPQRHMTE